MAEIGIFVVFEFDKDNKLRGDFYSQAKEHLPYRVKDNSLHEAYKPQHRRAWLKKARERINKSRIVIVIVGEDSTTAPGVKKEITIANQLYKPIFQIRPQDYTAGKVPGAKEMIPWDWRLIRSKIDELLGLTEQRK